MSIFRAKCKTINQYLRVHWQKVAQQAWKIARRGNLITFSASRLWGWPVVSLILQLERRDRWFYQCSRNSPGGGLTTCSGVTKSRSSIKRYWRCAEPRNGRKLSKASFPRKNWFVFFTLVWCFFSLMRAYNWSFSYMKKTLPKAQRTRGLSWASQSNLF